MSPNNKSILASLIALKPSGLSGRLSKKGGLFTLDRFTHKIVFVAEINHEGQIGKFIGQGGKNIKSLTSQVNEALGTKNSRISMVPSNEEMKRPPWKNKFIRLKT